MKTNREEEPAMPNRDFQDVLTDLDEGKVHQQLGEQLPKVVRAVLDTGKVGELNVKFKFAKEGRMVVVTSKVDAKIPQAATEATVFYADEQGQLHRSDPKQMPLRHVTPRPVSQLRDVPPTPTATTPTPAPKED